MTRFITVLCALAVLVAVPARAADQKEHAISPKTEFHFSHELLVGATTLKPGTYTFQCKMIGEQEFLVVTSVDEGKEVARVPCRPEELTAKIEMSDFRYTKRPDGLAQLTAVRIRGEKIAHRLILD
jgi:hypothetical protein